MQRGFKEPGEKPRRFYKVVEVQQDGASFTVTLDGRTMRTPGGAKQDLPTEALARQVAEEWTAQGEHLELGAMHANRLANTAIDAIPGARDASADNIAAFAGSDLLCYRADEPRGLVDRQAERWDPLIVRIAQEEGLVFEKAEGLIHRAQPDGTTAGVKALALKLDDFRLAGLAFATALYGSAILAVAVLRGWLDAREAYEVSRLDEAWQEERWGVDEEAAARTEGLRLEADMLERWLRNLDVNGN